MFKFLVEEDVTTTNPFASIKPVREPDKEIEIMSQEQLKRLFSKPNQRTFAGFRDYVIMNILYDGFLRITRCSNAQTLTNRF